MGALKGLVLTMGLLIVVAMGALAYGLYHKASNPDFRLFGGGADKPAGFGEVRLAAPSGCVIASSDVEGGRLFVRFGAAAGGETKPGCERIVVIDVASGATVGVVAVGGAP